MLVPSAVNPLPPHAKKVFQGKTYAVWQWEQKLFNGTTATFERFSRLDYTGALGVLPNKRILLIKDEQPDRGTIITPAGGQVEVGETPAEAAARELREETGYTTTGLQPWFSYQPQHRMIMLAHFFIARHLEKTSEPQLEGGERIEVVTYSFDEFLELGHEPLLRDWMLRIILLEAKLGPKKRAALAQLFYG